MIDIRKTNMLVLCLLLTLPVTVFACSCRPDPPTVMEEICGSEYAIKAEVTGMRDYVYGEYNATGKLIMVNILQTYKASAKYQTLTVKNEIHTGPHSAACSWEPPNGIYVIVGHISQGRPSIYSCSYARAWHQAPAKDKEVFQAYTDDGTQCNSTGGPITSLLAICVCSLLTMMLQKYV